MFCFLFVFGDVFALVVVVDCFFVDLLCRSWLESNLILLHCSLSAPSSPPIKLTAISLTSPYTMNVTWEDPTQLNGKALGYKFVFEKQLHNGQWEGIQREVVVCSPPVTLTGLDINSRYRVKVTAGTRKGYGPFSEYVEGGNLAQFIMHP